MRVASLLLPAALLIQAPAEASGRRDFNLPGGRLGDALVALGQQAGISVGVADAAVAARPVSALRGRMTVDRALARLLRDSGARAIAIDGRTYRVVRAPVRSRPLRRLRPAAPPRTAPPPDLEQPDIIVTASKRSIHYAAFPGSALFAIGDDPALDIFGRTTEGLSTRLPGLNSTHLGPGRNKLFIRGIADSSFNGPTQATVGQYLGETRLNYNTPDPNLRLHDIDRVEVLLGPQGTLYGAGSLGGIFRIVPNAPRLDRVEGSASAGLALTEHGEPGGEAVGVINVPLIDDAVGLRVVGYAAREGGYIDDTLRDLDDVNRTSIVGGRAKLRAQRDDWTIDLGLAGQRIRGADGQFADRDAAPLTRASPVAEHFANDYVLGDLRVEGMIGDDMRLVSTAGIVRQRLFERYDSTLPDGPVTVFDQTNRLTLLSTETRLSREGPNGTGWLIGASFISNDSEQERAQGMQEMPLPIAGVRNGVDEMTLFGEATIGLSETISATAGGRITHSRLSGEVLNAPFTLAQTFRASEASRRETVVLPSFALAARPRDDLILYARYQEGFRPGGLAVTAPFVARLTSGNVIVVFPEFPLRDVAAGRYENDEVATVEAGIRYGRPGAGAFDVTAAVSYTRWTDIQADVIDPGGFQTTSNIGDGRIYSLDLRVGWRPLLALAFEGAFVVNDSLVTNPAPGIIIVGRSPLPNVARFNGYLGASYFADLADDVRLRLWASARYAGRSRLGIGPILGEVQGDWADLGAGARLERERYAFTLGVTNILDTVGNRFAMGSPFTIAQGGQITPLRPRTIRLGWEIRF